MGEQFSFEDARSEAKEIENILAEEGVTSPTSEDYDRVSQYLGERKKREAEEKFIKESIQVFETVLLNRTKWLVEKLRGLVEESVTQDYLNPSSFPLDKLKELGLEHVFGEECLGDLVDSLISKDNFNDWYLDDDSFEQIGIGEISEISEKILMHSPSAESKLAPYSYKEYIHRLRASALWAKYKEGVQVIPTTKRVFLKKVVFDYLSHGFTVPLKVSLLAGRDIEAEVRSDMAKRDEENVKRDPKDFIFPEVEKDKEKMIKEGVAPEIADRRAEQKIVNLAEGMAFLGEEISKRDREIMAQYGTMFNQTPDPSMGVDILLDTKNLGRMLEEEE